MARTLKTVKYSRRLEGWQAYFVFLGFYLLLGAIVALFMIPQFRHAWIGHHEQPLVEYTLTGTDFEVEEYTVRNDDGETEMKEDRTYFLKVDVAGKEYFVETDYDIYDQVRTDSISHFGTDGDAQPLFYDKRKDQVFLGGYYSPGFHFFLWTFFIGLVLFFVVIPLWSKLKG